LFGSQPIEIRLQGERVFEGRLREVATPYVGFVTVVSLGAGVASLAITGWRQTARKSEAYEQKLATVEHQLKQKEQQLQEMLLSNEYLTNSGLGAFLEGSDRQIQEPQADAQSVATVASELFASDANLISHFVSQSAEPTVNPNGQAVMQIQDLQAQLQQILTQIEMLQGSLQASSPPQPTAAQQPVEAMLVELSQRLQAIDSNWTVQQVV
jgi:hypothetical protein